METNCCCFKEGLILSPHFGGIFHEILKAARFLHLVSMPWYVKDTTRGKCVTCCELAMSNTVVCRMGTALAAAKIDNGAKRHEHLI